MVCKFKTSGRTFLPEKLFLIDPQILTTFQIIFWNINKVSYRNMCNLIEVSFYVSGFWTRILPYTIGLAKPLKIVIKSMQRAELIILLSSRYTIGQHNVPVCLFNFYSFFPPYSLLPIFSPPIGKHLMGWGLSFISMCSWNIYSVCMIFSKQKY